MKKLRFKSILSMLCALCLVVGASTISYAADGNLNSALSSEDVVASFAQDAEGVPLPTTPDDGIVPYSGIIGGPFHGTTTDGRFGGTFTVPSEYNQHLIRVHWRCQATDGANASASFKMTITGNGLTYTVNLTANSETEMFSIATLPAGTYRYDVTPRANVSGRYAYAYQFYSY